MGEQPEPSPSYVTRGANGATRAWSAHEDAYLRELWPQVQAGTLRAKVAAELVSQRYCSQRNRTSLLGRAFRLGLSKPMGPRTLQPVKSISTSADDIRCKWPLGEPGTPGFHFCAKRREAGRPYCSTHIRSAYREPTESEMARRARKT